MAELALCPRANPFSTYRPEWSVWTIDSRVDTIRSVLQRVWGWKRVGSSAELNTFLLLVSPLSSSVPRHSG
eukprot:COSAG04_NODE_27026_length_287_cov_1.367021_1_plen_70_part_01